MCLEVFSCVFWRLFLVVVVRYCKIFVVGPFLVFLDLGLFGGDELKVCELVVIFPVELEMDILSRLK